MQNWIVWNRSIFVCETELFEIKLFFGYLNCILMLNWIVWNRTVYMYKNGFGIKWPSKVDVP